MARASRAPDTEMTGIMVTVQKAAATALAGIEAAPTAVTAARPALAAAHGEADDKGKSASTALLTAPIPRTLLKQTFPTMTVLVAQTAVNVAEAYYVGFLGTDALAGAALVFPIFMLTTMMSNGGLGSGVASSGGRAGGAGRQQEGNGFVVHAIGLGGAGGALFPVAAELAGPLFYRALGGRGDALDAA